MVKKLLVIFAGVVFVIVGIYIFNQGNEMSKRCTEEVVGTVIEVKKEVTNDKNDGTAFMYYPVIEYNTGKRIIRKKHNVGSSRPKYNVGQSLTVLFDPNEPDVFIIKGDKDANFFGVIFIVVGGFFAIAGFVVNDVR